MNPKKIHNLLGMILFLPLLGWVFTGVVFLVKPGYRGAYEQISPKQYAIEKSDFEIPRGAWVEVRVLRTILGEHVLAKVDDQWQHLDSVNFRPLPRPSEDKEVLLLSDAISSKSERYGTIERREGDFYLTSTGIELGLNWNTLSISQKGNDTRFINLLYKIHYLQWLGHKQANTVLGVVGLFLLSLLVCYGFVLYLRKQKR